MEELSTNLCRRKNKPVASGVVEAIIQILDRNTVDTDEKQLGCVQYVTNPSVKCRDTAGRAALHLFHQSETLFDPCCAETQGIQVSKRSQGNRQTLPSRPMAGASVGGAGHDDDD
jgi:hypothetical protein